MTCSAVATVVAIAGRTGFGVVLVFSRVVAGPSAMHPWVGMAIGSSNLFLVAFFSRREKNQGELEV